MIFNFETGVMILPIDLDRFTILPPFQTQQDTLLTLKTEFHITIIGSQLARKLLVKLGTVEYQARLTQIAKTIDWNWTFQSEFYHLVKPKTVTLPDGSTEILEAQSIIQMATVAGINDFYEEISILVAERLVEERLIPPPTHVTLYVYGDIQGIGIASQDDMMRYACLLPNLIGR
jgi:hypothetical protein